MTTEIKAVHTSTGWLVYVIHKREVLSFRDIVDLIAQHGLTVDAEATTEERIVAR